MKTRTKQKVEKEIVANKCKEMEITGDFFLEDFGKVKHLIRSSRNLSKNSESDRPSSCNKSSIESERKYRKAKENWIQNDQSNKSDTLKRQTHSRQNFIDISSRNSDSSEKMQSQLPDKQNDDTAKLWEATSSKLIPQKRRDIKHLNKIEQSFQHFYNLVKDLHSGSLFIKFPHFSDDSLIKSKNDSLIGCKELIEENSVSSNPLLQESEEIIDAENVIEIEDRSAESNNSNKTSDRSNTSEPQQSSQIAQEISNEYIQERLGSLDQNIYESITLIPECYQSQMRIACWNKHPLNNNQSIHCQIAYFITDIMKRRYFNEQYKIFMEREKLRVKQSSYEDQMQQSSQSKP